MLLDCFMFTNEYDILEGRLEYLSPRVDKFIIVESNITHSGKAKRLNFLDNAERYSKYLHKIFYYPSFFNKDDYDFTIDPNNLASRDTGHWKVENLQRNHIQNALNFFDEQDDVLISDLDEIPTKHGIDLALHHLAPDNPLIGFKQNMFFYNFKQMQEHECFGTVLCKNKTSKERTPQWIREQRWGHQIPYIFNGGYHLSYWGTPESILNKMINMPHQEFNKKRHVLDIDNVRKNIKLGIDVHEREENVLIPVDRNTIEPEVLTAFEKYGINI